MAVLKSSHEQIAKLYQQLLNVLEELVIQAGEQDSRDVSDDESGLILSLVEEAEERGLDEESVQRILKIVAHMRKKTREE